MAVQGFQLTDDQKSALTLLGGDQVHTMLFGGSRSGKTFLIVRTIIIRAMKVPNSRHLMARFRLTDIEGSIIAETWPNVVSLCFPELEHEIDMKKADRYFLMPNGSEVWWAGLDDKDRTEKILGKEFATTFLNECSQIPWYSRNMVTTRLAQKTWLPNPDDPDGSKGLPRLPGLRLRAYYDENPPLKTHWTHKLFIERKSPDTNKLVPNPANYNCRLMNPEGNRANLAPEYLAELDNLPDRLRKRFRDGRFGEAGEGALWTEELLEQQRIDNEADLPEFQRIVIGVDPSGSRDVEDMHRDEIGIVVAALGTDGKGYVLEDLTRRGSPAEWGKTVCEAYRRWGADRVVAETNFGGAMVGAVIKSAAADISRDEGIVLNVAFSEVTASRGKVARAEPISALYEQHAVFHLDGLAALEAEMCNFTVAGYLGDKSPNRVDAAVWALNALFHAVVKASREIASSRGSTPKVNLGHSALKQRMAHRGRR
jgi:hypothetical protein